MKTYATAIFFFGFLLCQIPPVFALQATSSGDYNTSDYNIFIEQATETVIRNIRMKVMDTLSSDERSIESSIGYIVPMDGLVNAYADYKNERRVIYIPVGIVEMMDLVLAGYLAENELGLKGCYEYNLDKLLKVYYINSSRIAKKQNLYPTPTLSEFASKPSSPCYYSQGLNSFHTSQAIAKESYCVPGTS
jgi:hypothetical protein